MNQSPDTQVSDGHWWIWKVSRVMGNSLSWDVPIITEVFDSLLLSSCRMELLHSPNQ